MKTLTITCFGFLAFVILVVAGSVQEPHVRKCEGSDDSIIAIDHVKITDAKLGKTAKFEVEARVKHTYGVNPILKISFARPDGQPAQCAYLIFPEELRLCGGNTDSEKELTADWKNTCPIKEGKYSARLSIYIPDISLARECVQCPDEGLRRLRGCRYLARVSAHRCRLAGYLPFWRPEDLLDGPELLILVVALRGYLEQRRDRS
ncbi:hypothetical protein HPB49_019801 [Dermacentor silvarum]|uniref:Uncharacterized protein n=1 Tax=Dermacentor silvarum TaxID=543639 RepID=A0ACB8C592_DERSI|nr:hypothetical protein HPB49_019801 [Dermacentor silvarum]